jgi:hypothetical protein
VFVYKIKIKTVPKFETNICPIKINLIMNPKTFKSFQRRGALNCDRNTSVVKDEIGVMACVKVIIQQDTM